jgi:hypothetical protein
VDARGCAESNATMRDESKRLVLRTTERVMIPWGALESQMSPQCISSTFRSSCKCSCGQVCCGTRLQQLLGSMCVRRCSCDSLGFECGTRIPECARTRRSRIESERSHALTPLHLTADRMLSASQQSTSAELNNTSSLHERSVTSSRNETGAVEVRPPGD